MFPKTKYRPKAKAMNGKARSLEEMTHGELEHLLDSEVSFWVRGSRAVKGNGYVSCYTCRAPHSWKELDAGHYIGRAHRGTRWDLRNIRPQCTKCNSYEEGKHWKFRQNLVLELGAETVEEMEQIADMYGDSKMSREWLIDQIRKWRTKNASLRKELKGL